MTDHKAAMIAEIEQGFDQLMEVVASIDEERMSARKDGDAWSIKDELAHLAAWEEVLLRFYMGEQPFAEVIGLPGARYGMISEDEINAHLFERHRDRTTADIISYLKETHAAVMDKVAATDSDTLNSPMANPEADPEKVSPLTAYVKGDTVGHYKEHLQTIIAAIAD